MSSPRSCTALVGLFLALACSDCALDPGAESSGEASNELRAAGWSSSAPPQQRAYRGGQVASLHGLAYLVTSGDCGSWSCGGDSASKDLYWAKRTATGWTAPARIPGQRSSSRVSLAAFNGSLYMVYTGESDPTAVWISRFDPRSEAWTPGDKLAYYTHAGPPAIAAFDGKLHFVGTMERVDEFGDSSYPMWSATMTADQVYSPARPIFGKVSTGRPSLAVHGERLVLVHGEIGTGAIVISSRGPGAASWTSDAPIATSPGDEALRSDEPVLAAANGDLHLVYRQPDSSPVWWTSFDACAWTAPVRLDPDTSTPPALTAAGPGLVLATTSDETWHGIVARRRVSISELAAPPAPAPGGCQVTASPNAP